MAKKIAKGSYASGMYQISGDKLARKRQFCPKCGPGYFLAGHNNRQSCGKCHYTQFNKK